MHASFDRRALSVVESAYAMTDDLAGWLDGVFRAVTPLLDHGHGVHGYVYEADGSDAVSVSSSVIASPRTPPGLARAAELAVEAIPRALVPRMFCRAPAITCMRPWVRANGGDAYPDFRPFDAMAPFGFVDMYGLAAYDPGGVGLLMCAPTNRSEEDIPPGIVERWRRLHTHLLAGLRLQRALADDGRDDAVLDPAGRVLHAEGAARTAGAREALRQRARHIDRARSAAGRRDPSAALAAWTGLVDGTWSLVDRFDRDGRRYLVARRNDPRLALPRPLSARERQVLAYAALGHSNKHIAYTLGLSASTVSTHLRRAMGYLGIPDRATLAHLWPGSEDPSGCSRGGPRA